MGGDVIPAVLAPKMTRFLASKLELPLCCALLPCICTKLWLSPQGGLAGLHFFLYILVSPPPSLIPRFFMY